VVETVASLRDEGRLPEGAEGWARDFRDETLTVPSQVQTLIETRLNRLDELSRQTLTAASVIRGGFDAGAVQSVSGRSQLETLESLERLLGGGLLVEEAGERFAFSHDKIREVAYAGLSRLRRKLLHRRMAESLEARYRGREETVAGRLAHHYERASVREKALEYHLRAGHVARKQYAHPAAVGHYQKALGYLKEEGNHERAARTLMQLGLTYHTAFEFERSRQAYQEGFALWQAAGQTRSTPTAPRPPHALRMLWVNPLTLDPALSYGPYASNLVDQLFSGLVELRPNLDVVPDVARSWEISGGGRRYVFYLRDDVYWSDGVRVTAGDFEYAWKRILDPATGARSEVAGRLYNVKGARAFHQGEGNQENVAVSALDDLTLRVELEEPAGYFLHLLADTATYPVPRHVVKTYGDDWAQEAVIVTNGAFRLDAWRPMESMAFSRAPRYYGRFAGNLERVELHLAPDRSAELEMYEAGQTDAIGLAAMPSEGVKLARHRQAGDYVTAPGLTLEYVGFDVRRPPFDDPAVRRAFALATDRETLAHIALRGYASPATGGLVPAGLPGHSPEIGWRYDPGAAREALAQAGYPDGAGFPHLDMPGLRGWETSAGYLAARWREILGVDVRPDTMGWEAYQERMGRELPHIYLLGWLADYPDPDNFLRLAVSDIRGYTGWANQAYDRLVGRARRATDQNQRMRLYQQADKILVEEASVVPTLYGRIHLLIKPWVRNFPVSPVGAGRWKDVIIEPH
jgi:oligopeptide transport system substrate-binding protein